MTIWRDLEAAVLRISRELPTPGVRPHCPATELAREPSLKLTALSSHRPNTHHSDEIFYAATLTSTRIFAICISFFGNTMIRHILLFLALSFVTITALANPWQTAVKENDVKTLSALLLENKAQTHEFGPNMWLEATVLEHTDVLTWLLGNNVPGGDSSFGEHKMSLWRVAFAHQKLKAAQWMVNNELVGMVDKDDVGPWGLAAGFDFIEMLNWLRDSKIPVGDPIMIWRSAFSNGRVLALQWLFDNHIDIPPHADGRNLWLFAATYDHTDTLDWALRVNLPGRDATDINGENMWLLAATFGNLKVLKWLHKNDPENFKKFEPEIRQIAIANEHYNITGWLTDLAGTYDNVRSIIQGLTARGSY